MKKIFTLSILLIVLMSFPAQAAKLPDELIQDAILVFREIAEQPDAEHFQSMVKRAHGIAIFPSVIKAGIGLGGRYGDGLILEYDSEDQSWRGPFFVNLKGLSYGFQVGIQSTALVLVVTSERGMDNFKEGKITLGGNLSIAAGPLGRSAEAGTDLGLKAAIYSYSLSKGAFIGASLEGATIDNSVNANQVYWQEKLTPTEIFSKEAKGASIEGLLQELRSITN